MLPPLLLLLLLSAAAAAPEISEVNISGTTNFTSNISLAKPLSVDNLPKVKSGPPLAHPTSTPARPQPKTRPKKRLPRAKRSKTTRTPKPARQKETPAPQPGLQFKQNIIFRSGHPDFILGESPDSMLVVRHAPIPRPGSPWPLPQHYTELPKTFLINRWNFRFVSGGQDCHVLQEAIARTKRNVFDVYNQGLSPSTVEALQLRRRRAHVHDNITLAQVSFLNVTVLKPCDEYPSLRMDESYDLTVRRGGVVVLARQVWGAIRGLETFSQLVHEDAQGRLVIRCVTIRDFPRFPHRGVLLDTARHFLDKQTILNNLEAMAHNKMNVLHWHMVDDQSFPFESKVYPNLTKYGAYDATTHVYTHDDIRDIIQAARVRGVRIIPELDTPGHTLAWGYGSPHLLTPCYHSQRAASPNGLFGPINPVLNSTYSFLENLFQEVLDLFPDQYLHLGGDEVPFGCWLSNPDIQEFNRKMAFGSGYKNLLNYYETRLLETVQGLGRARPQGSGAIVWQEVFDNNVQLWNDTIVQIWMAHLSEISRFTTRGQRVLFSSCWYLDWIGYGVDWTKYYLCQSGASDMTRISDEDERHLLGGEACLWMEYADDANALTRLWPRASAAAERLWSDKTVNDAGAAAPRVEEQRCRMKRLGLPVGVLGGPGHCPRTLAEELAQVPELAGVSADANFVLGWTGLGEIQVEVVPRLVLLLPLVGVVLGLVILVMLQSRVARARSVSVLLSVGQSGRVRLRTVLVLFLTFAGIWSLWLVPLWVRASHSMAGTVSQDEVT